MNYRSFVGPEDRYDIMGALQFTLMTYFLGMRESNTLLDIGCGSLRAGRLFIPYLNPGNYFGIDPNLALVNKGLEYELGEEIRGVKQPSFMYRADFSFRHFDTKFDFLLAQSVFSHASEDQIRLCFRNAKEVMHKESVFAATFFKGKKDYKGDSWVYPDIVPYTFKTISNIAREEAGLMTISIHFYHPSQQWVLMSNPDNILWLTNASHNIK